jgi:hypothetical protein
MWNCHCVKCAQEELCCVVTANNGEFNIIREVGKAILDQVAIELRCERWVGAKLTGSRRGEHSRCREAYAKTQKIQGHVWGKCGEVMWSVAGNETRERLKSQTKEDPVYHGKGMGFLLRVQLFQTHWGSWDTPDLSLASGGSSLPRWVELALVDTQGSGCRHLHGFGSFHQLPVLLCPVWPAAAFASSTSTCLQSRTEHGGAGHCAGWAAGEPHGHCIQLP